MANGNPGDDPAIDILVHNIPRYGKEVDALVRSISRFMDFRRLQDLLDACRDLSIDDLRTKLAEMLLDLQSEAKARGWEIDE